MKKKYVVAPAEIAPNGHSIETPFLLAQQLWDTRTGAVVAQRRTWQRTALAAIGAVVVLSGALAYTVGTKTIVPYVVEVGETGQVRNVGMLPTPWNGQHTAPVEFVVREWLQWVRTVSTDPVMLSHNWTRARQFMTVSGFQTLKSHFEEQKARLDRRETVSIEFSHMLAVPGKTRTFEAEWIETTYNAMGNVISTVEMKALLAIAVFPPTDLQRLKELQNPLGIFVESPQFAERIKPGKSS